ncbi:hypothetical protein ACFOND_06485 [Reinekea marina]|uniref:VanZ like protein n=1 Tax=Reinekea marina TaxID=1310421 RepID=A0ABV7WQ03_9GAMM
MLKTNKPTLGLLAMVPIASLFFVGGPSAAALPWFRYAWNLGHIGFFFIATWAFCSVAPLWSRDKPWRYLAAIAIASLLIESIQFTIGRNLSLMDIARNITGAALALSITLKDRAPKAMFMAGLVFVLIDFSLFTKVAIQDWHYQHRHPIIENFETSQFLSFWPKHITQQSREVLEGNYAGYVRLTAGKFSGIQVSPVLRDWSAYRAIQVAIFNSQSFERPITIRMHDVLHEQSDQKYADRFNRTVMLQPGWNKLSLALTDVEKTTSGRVMDVSNMHQIGIFYSGLEQDDYLILDDIRLIP